MPSPSPAEPARSEGSRELLEQMRLAGLKLTPQRLAIARALSGDRSHPTAQQIYERLVPDMPTMSFTTVYNTLAKLTELGLMASRAFTPGPTRFDPDVASHDHAVCEGCGVVIDVPQSGEPLTSPLPGFELRAVERVYRGRCSACGGSQRCADGAAIGLHPPVTTSNES